MFAPGEIVYGFAKGLYRPKYKYAVSIFRDADLNILAQFTTSKDRRGYVIEAGVELGQNPQSGETFSFAKRTVITYDYGFLYGTQEQLASQFDNPVVVCKMYGETYINLVYALYKSIYFPAEYKPYLEQVLIDFYK